MLASAFTARKEARRLEHDWDIELFPRQCGWVALGEHADLLAVDRNPVSGDLDGVRETTKHGVVTQQMSQGLGIGQIVDRDDLNIGGAGIGRAQDVTADAAEAVDGNTSHGESSLKGRCGVNQDAVLRS